MKKDIILPKVEDVAVAIVPEEVPTGEMAWNVFLINLKKEDLTGVLVSSRGYGENKKTGQQLKTSMLRHFLDTVEAKSYCKIEPISEEVFGLSNEYWVSFFLDSTMYDKKYIFMAESIKKENFINIPVLNKQGVMIK